MDGISDNFIGHVKDHSTGGAPRKLLPPGDAKYALIEKMAAEGVLIEHMGKPFGMCRNRFNEIRRDDPRIEEAIQRGRADLASIAASTIVQKAQKGDLTASMYILNHMFGLNGRPNPSLQINTGGGNVRITLPAARPDEASYIDGEVVDD